ncbi:MAG TPA: hypothetical protein VF765_01720 [Polyangiaceae bacterium]
MRSVGAAAVVILAIAASACGKSGHASDRDDRGVPAPQGTECGHTACGANFFVDGAQVGDCPSGANCTAKLTLVATGDFHINDQYPYKFKADEAAGITFRGTDRGGPNVFSKDADDWHKTGAQSGVMNVTFQAADRGARSITGNFKLSVCSAASCQLEQQTVTVPVAVR